MSNALNKHPGFFSGEEGVDEGETTEEKGHRRIRQTSRRYSEEPNRTKSLSIPVMWCPYLQADNKIGSGFPTIYKLRDKAF